MSRDSQPPMPASMQAAVLRELRQPLEVTTVELPGDLFPGQVLVRIHYTGICGSQLGEIDGVKGPDKYLPHLLGHEGSGEVVRVGPGVRQVKPGDRVVLHWRKGAGIEAEPARYVWNGRPVNAGWVTTFSEYSIVSENRMTTIPPESDLRVAALLGCAVTTGFGVVENDAKVRIGESVVVYGAGGVGLSMVQAAALSAAYPIVAVDLHDRRLDLARAVGATHLINASTGDPDSAIQGALGGAGADVFIDNTGKPSIIEMGYRLTTPQGRVVLVGVPVAGANISIHSLALHFGKRLVGSHGGDAMPHVDIPRFWNLYRAGRLRLQELITDEYDLVAINRAIADLRNGTVAGRCVVRIDARATAGRV